MRRHLARLLRAWASKLEPPARKIDWRAEVNEIAPLQRGERTTATPFTVATTTCATMEWLFINYPFSIEGEPDA